MDKEETHCNSLRYTENSKQQSNLAELHSSEEKEKRELSQKM